MPTIVVSGVPGAGSSTIAKLLAKKLRLKHFSAGDYSKKFGRGKETEKAITYMLSTRGSSKGFHKKVDEYTKKIARKGNVVIDAKLGIRMLKKIDNFSVWLKAPKEVRARRVAGRDNISYTEAMKKITQKEKLEKRRWHDIYGFNYFEQEKEADIVIDAGNKTPEEIAELIIKKIRTKGIT